MIELSPISFPKDFIFGASTSAYQIEGAAREGNKGVSIWDTYCKKPGAIANGDTGDIACDFYHRYKGDIELMKRIGLDSFRFSISWPRIFPDGYGDVNSKGLAFYDNLINELLANDIQPFVTLNHWDFPQKLQNKGGWENRDTIKHFADYAKLMGEKFGDRVKMWTTHNEPYAISAHGNISGFMAPGKKDVKTGLTITHNLNIAHGSATQALRAVIDEDSQVGIVLALFPIYPATASFRDIEAAHRWDGYYNRCFLEPIFNGRYPDYMLEYFGDKFPEVTDSDLRTINQPVNMLGVNCYSRRLILNCPENSFIGGCEFKPRDSAYTQMEWEIYPECIYEMLTHLQQEYKVENLYITENGAAFYDEVSQDDYVHDNLRIKYLHSHIEQAKNAIENGVRLRGYFIWSLLDNFEWAFGYSRRFGIIYVDYETQQRIPKDSSKWYSKLINYNKYKNGTLLSCVE